MSDDLDARILAAEQEDAEALEAALKDLTPREQALVRDVLRAYPLLTIEQALRQLKAFGGL